ncbi:class I SAM-dependent methyltransferase [Pacificoceanicola onchidii]|uniref:class I SAM-dependent methyltransferase n=1 Tax=Pacificoceanicola onchidii TaxID=2562685 RepID=UPI0010A3D9F4|nr:class I SAM-dependent methyltransferase [Pacificoceanicola onchidii]
MDWSAFFELHKDLPREGPGRPEDVAWALGVAGVKPGARILDAGCGPGADIQALLLATAPGGHVTAVDAHAPFIEQAAKRWGRDSRVTLTTGDMRAAEGPFDVIWCAGALYFLGLRDGLDAMRGKLAPGGTLVFSELVFRVPEPSEPVRCTLTKEYPAIGTTHRLNGIIEAEGFEIVAQKMLPRASWEAYYGPMDQRIARLRPGADAALAAVLDEGAAEAALWRAHNEEFGYALSVLRAR